MEISSECLQPSTKGKRIQPRERSDGVSSMIARGRKAISRQLSAFSQGAPHLAVPRDPPIVRTTWGRAFWPAMTPSGGISRAVARPDSVCPAPRWTKGTPPAEAQARSRPQRGKRGWEEDGPLRRAGARLVAPEGATAGQMARPTCGSRESRLGRRTGPRARGLRYCQLMPTVLIAGGGLAGLSAAAALGGAGFEVDLFESRPFLGGRATSYPLGEENIDNCQHILLRCCVNLLDFYRRMGVGDRIRFHREFYFIKPGGRISALRRGRLPAPFHCAGSFLGLKCLGRADKLGIARALAALRRERVRRTDLERLAITSRCSRTGRRRGPTDDS